MAIRKFRSKMKPIIWVITILFFITLIAGFAGSLSIGKKDSQYALEVNGEKVQGMSIQRVSNVLQNTYSGIIGKQIDSDVINIISMNEVINKKLAIELADDLKIKVSGSEVKEQIDLIKANFKTDAEYKQAILAQGYTSTTLKNEIEEGLTIQKLRDELVKGKDVTPEEKEIIFLTELEKMKKTAKYEDVQPPYNEYLEKDIETVDGITLTNVDLAKKTINEMLMTKVDSEVAKSEAEVALKKEAKLLSYIIKDGVKVDENLPFDLRLNLATEGLYNKIKSEVKYTDEDLENYLIENQESYNIKESANADVVVFEVSPSDKEKEMAKKEAEELLKNVTPENFAEMAKEHSQGPTGPNGGSLGTFTKGQMVKPFEEAVFAGENGKIYPEVVESQFGYHIIYVQNKDDENGTAEASHILIIPTAGDETKENLLKKIEDLKSKLKDNTVTFENLNTDEKVVFNQNIDVVKGGFIPGIGYNNNLIDSIFEESIGEISTLEEENKFIVYRKNSQTEAKSLPLSEVKEEVIEDYVGEKSKEEYDKVVNGILN